MQLCLLAVLALINAAPPVSQENGPTLRIGLTRAFGHPPSLTMTPPEGARVSNGERDSEPAPAHMSVLLQDGKVIAQDLEGKTLASGTRICLAPAESGECTSISLKKSARRYRGILEVAAGTEGLLVINELPIETYLRGVIAAEMPPSAPAEALRAQSIAARSYALKNRGRYRTRGYDLSDNTDCQVYGGADAEKLSTDTAVRDTAGLVLLKDGVLLLADFYDDCGGVTSPGDHDGDYPPSVRDAEEQDGPDYCAQGIYHTWSLTLSPEALVNLLSEKERKRAGKVTEVRVAEADKSGRANAVEIAGENGSIKMTGSAFRGRIGYSKLRSTLFTISKIASGIFTIRGKGNGHGQGLCQMGAMGMAAAPYNHSCQEILAHYFPGSEIAPFTGQAASPQPDLGARGTMPSRNGRATHRHPKG